MTTRCCVDTSGTWARARPARKPALAPPCLIVRTSVSRELHRALDRVLLRRDRERQAGAYLGLRVTIDPRLANREVEREIVPHPPDRSAEYGERLPGAEFPLVIHFRDGTNLPVVRALDDRPDEQVGAMVARERRAGVEVNRSPFPPLRHDAEKARAHAVLVVDARQQDAELGGHARS